MKLIRFLSTSAATFAVAAPQNDAQPSNSHEWLAPGPGDFRGPCPMLNTLTNHGFLPRDGRNLTKVNVVAGLKAGLNFNTSLGELMWQQAIIANPEPNATFFTLEMLNVHGVLEHDASLSRADSFFGNNHVFDETIFKQSRKWWTDESVTVEQLAHSKLYRQLQSRATNPNYTFTASMEEFSLGELSAPIIAFGNLTTGVVSRSLMEYFFVNERLPMELGWKKKDDEITLADILSMTRFIRTATNLLTGSDSALKIPLGRRLDTHAGLFE